MLAAEREREGERERERDKERKREKERERERERDILVTLRSPRHQDAFQHYQIVVVQHQAIQKAV
jgi:hypothetical protein